MYTEKEKTVWSKTRTEQRQRKKERKKERKKL